MPPISNANANANANDWDVVVVGAGAAGLLAAERAAARGRKTLLVEKNDRPGVKIMMSGGTRCNLTHDTDARGIIAAFGKPGRFLHSALASLGPRELVQLVEAEGLATKVEEHGKVFPVSDRATDVLAALLRRLERSGAVLALDEPLLKLQCDEAGWRFETLRRAATAQAVVITTGGQSYPGCGATGDGYTWAAQFGHSIVPPVPALVPLTTHAAWVADLKGLTIEDVIVRVVELRPAVGGGTEDASAAPARRPLDERRGSFLFTHFGLSGPVVLDVSRVVARDSQPNRLALDCDFLPAVGVEAFAIELRDACQAEGGKHVAPILARRLPRRLVDALLRLARVPAERRGGEVTRQERQAIIAAVKSTRIPVAGTLGFRRAEVTAGGVALDQVDSRTMQSKLATGLYFAGEVLDLDGPIGGYNFQAAFSTGWLAGNSCAAT